MCVCTYFILLEIHYNDYLILVDLSWMQFKIEAEPSPSTKVQSDFRFGHPTFRNDEAFLFFLCPRAGHLLFLYSSGLRMNFACLFVGLALFFLFAFGSP